MSEPLSAETIAIVKSTVPVMREHGLAITTRMYERLFTDPAMKALFDQGEAAEQPKRLAAAILAYAGNVDNLPALTGAIERIAHRHVDRHIRAEHYPAVANALLPAIKDVLGDAAEDSVLNAWGKAYWFLADVLIHRESAMYAQAT